MIKFVKFTSIVYVMLSLFWLCSCQKPQPQQKPNVLLICVDDLRPELNSFGAKYIISPNIDQLAKKGVSFQNHFVNAPSCGPSRYTLLTGQYGPSYNDALFQRSVAFKDSSNTIAPTMPQWFKSHGYTTVSVGKVSHHPGGRGGPDWNDSTALEIPNAWDRHLMPVGPWEHPRGTMHGLAHGEIRNNPNEMDVYQSAEGADDIYPDGNITKTALAELQTLTSDPEKPFFLAVGIIKPHLPFGAPKSYLDLYDDVAFPAPQNSQKPEGPSTWHPSGEFMSYNRWGKDPNTDQEFAEEVRRHYAACVTYADVQVGQVLAELKRTGADKNTIVVLWGDHGWHWGEHAIWGKHSLFEESLHSPLIIYDPTHPDDRGESNSIVQTLDIFPTLCDLTGIDSPDFARGTSLKPILKDPAGKGHPAFAYYNDATTIRTKTHRLILHTDGFVELYDHRESDRETINRANENPELVKELTEAIKSEFPKKFL